MDANHTIDSKIKQQFQSEFNRFESKPPVDGWNRLEASLNAPASSKFVIRRRWYASSAAAILALVLGGALFLWNDTKEVETSDTAYDPRFEIITIEPIQSEEMEIIPQYEIIVPQYVQPILAQTPHIIVPQVEQTQTPEVIEEEVIEEPHTQPSRRTENRLNNNRLSEESILIAGMNNYFLNDLPQRRRRDNVSVAVGGRGGLVSFHTAVNTPMTLRAVSAEADNTLSHNLSRATDHTAVKEHAQPISFGATVSIPLVPNLSIETGLVYTFLSSRVISVNSDYIGRETQRFHYLGIPLIVNYRVFQFNHLNLYASAGGMIETDILGERRIVGYALESHSERTERISQSNPQLSVNAGVGASFPLFNRFRLYGRVGGAYYFDARNEHRTIYSDRQIVLDLNFGIRYEF